MFWGWFFPSEKVTPPTLFLWLGRGFLIVGHVGSCWMCSWQVKFHLLLFLFLNLPPSEMRTGLFPRLFDVGGVQNFCLSCLGKGGIIGGAKFLVNIIPPVHKWKLAGLDDDDDGRTPPIWSTQLRLIYPALSLSLSVHTRGATGWGRKQRKVFHLWSTLYGLLLLHLSITWTGWDGRIPSLLFARRSECNPLRFQKSLPLSFSHQWENGENEV